MTLQVTRLGVASVTCNSVIRNFIKTVKLGGILPHKQVQAPNSDGTGSEEGAETGGGVCP